jgi:hypothetical protein
VTLGITTNDPTEAQVYYPSTLTFTSATWNLAQIVKIQGIADTDADGVQPFRYNFVLAMPINCIGLFDRDVSMLLHTIAVHP